MMFGRVVSLCCLLVLPVKDVIAASTEAVYGNKRHGCQSVNTRVGSGNRGDEGGRQRC